MKERRAKKYSWLRWGFLILSILALVYLARNQTRQKCPISQLATHCHGLFCMPQDVLQKQLALTEEERQDLGKIRIKEVRRRLLEASAIRTGSIKKLYPDTLVVEYALRKPMFCIGDISNFAVDEDGVVFALSPYFPALTLPILYMPLQGSLTKEGLSALFEKELLLFKKLVRVAQRLGGLGFFVKEIDACQAHAPGVFYREILVRVARKGRSGLLSVRLPVEGTFVALDRLGLIEKKFPEYCGTIDLRFENVAYLDHYFENGDFKCQK